MKKNIVGLIAIFVLFIGLFSVVKADILSFNVSLGVGSQNSAEVMKLQNFLVSQNFLKVQPTGYYLSMTKSAVMAFQASQGIEQTGYFGPLTRAAANKIIVAANVKPAVVAEKSVSSSGNGLAAGVILSKNKTITWQTSGYPTGVGLNINLLRKISDSPASYTFIRSIAKDTPNDGQETWIPGQGENGNDIYIEITCSTTHQFKQGCQIAGEPMKAN